MPVQTYASFQEMFRRKSTLDELIQRLKVFSRWSVLFTCSGIGIILKLWERSGWEKRNYPILLDSFFGVLRATWLKLAAQFPEPSFVFHRRQLLFIMKLAIEHCPDVGRDVLETPPGPFGAILLMANDHLHYNLVPFPEGGLDDFDKVSRLVAEFLPVTEFSGFTVGNKLTRAFLITTTYTARLRTHPDYIDVPTEYEHLTGISLRDYQALTLGLMARIMSLISLETLRKNPEVAAIRPVDFHQTQIPKPTIEAFFREFADTSENILNSLQQDRREGRDYGSSDFTAFRRKPLITEGHASLTADANFVVEKFETGPYWRVNNSSRETGNRLRRFWGPVFEAYVNDLTKAHASNFIPDPRLLDNHNDQLCDGLIVDGDSLVLMEYKASMFTADAKYSGDYIKLRDEIAKKLVKDSADGSKKGVEQLAAAIRALFSGPSRKAVSGLDVSHIKRVYPLLLTLDDLGSSLLISKLLNFYFKDAVDPSEVQGIEVKPLLCTDIETFEAIVPYLSEKPISWFLQQWLDQDPLLLSTLMEYFPQSLTGRRNEWLQQAYEQVAEQASQILFNQPRPPRANRVQS
ncbi:MAG: hypothetical protein LAO78_06675 [Acidobacteriia bacterium]|nr:hypothetical protein [Terriglobia bacterium]